MLIHGFDWDDGNRDKCQKHGLAVTDIEFAFEHKALRTYADDKHSQLEQRHYAVSLAPNGRYVFMVFTRRKKGDLNFIRPISARYMHKKEIQKYETQTA